MNYQEQYKHPNWQKKRLEILERDNWQCRQCGSKDDTLSVHHKWYSKDKMIWEYTDSCYVTLCDECHSEIHICKNLIKEEIDVNFTFVDEYLILHEIFGYISERGVSELLEIRELIKKFTNNG